MTKTKSTKRALLLSALSLLMCVSMLIGSTYAWFTDSVVSGNNIIKAGNLDIVLEYSTDGDTWNTVDATTKVFNDQALWEPGHREVVMFRVRNAGTLHLKYELLTTVIEEKGSVNVYGDEFKLSDYLTLEALSYAKEGLGFDQMVDNFFASRDVWFQMDEFKFGENMKVNGSVQEMAPGYEHYYFVAITMPETVGNEANYATGNDAPYINFAINLVATQYTAESDSFDNQYDKDAKLPIVVRDAEHAQAVLDTLENGSSIQLLPGVDYGTLEVRAQVGAENKKPIATNANTKVVDYFTSKYPTGEYARTFENITIIGAPGATVDSIKFVTGTFNVVTDPTSGKASGTMYQFVEVKNLVIDGVEFTDASTSGAAASFVSPIFMDLQSVKVDGLTVKNCTLEGNVSNMNFVYAYGNAAKDSTFGVTLNNVVIANNTVSGIARLAELREANNVTIKGNKVSNTTRELALLANNTDKVYSGDIICSDNVVVAIAGDYAAQGKEGLFFRVGAGGDANIVVKDNVITNSGCVESSFVGVTGHTGTLTVENNTLS